MNFFITWIEHVHLASAPLEIGPQHFREFADAVIGHELWNGTVPSSKIAWPDGMEVQFWPELLPVRVNNGRIVIEKDGLLGSKLRVYDPTECVAHIVIPHMGNRAQVARAFARIALVAKMSPAFPRNRTYTTGYLYGLPVQMPFELTEHALVLLEAMVGNTEFVRARARTATWRKTRPPELRQSIIPVSAHEPGLLRIPRTIAGVGAR